MIWLLLLLAVLVLQPVIIGLSEHRNPEKALAWIFVATLLPLAGLILFYYIEKEFRPQKYSLQSASRALRVGPNGTGTLPGSLRQDLQQQDVARHQIDERQNDAQHLQAAQHQEDAQRLEPPCGTRDGAAVPLRRLPPSPVIGCSRSEVLAEGELAFQAMLETMERAKDHIHVEFYTIRDDGIGTSFQRMWIRKARQGVKVRILYDGLGSKDLSDAYVQALREEGVDIRCFLPPRTFFRAGRINHRNHRKVAIVDGWTGFLGGLNIGDEYIGKHPELGYWRDTHLKLEGEAVRELERLFLHDWASASGEPLNELHKMYLGEERADGAMPDRHAGLPGDAKVRAQTDDAGEPVQIIASGPDTGEPGILYGYLCLLHSARRTILWTTPYFIPDAAVCKALKSAVLSGVDVRILLPYKPDHRLVQLASLSYVKELLQAGVRFYLYKKGFIHAKTLVVDDAAAAVGTANLDLRSLYKNYELTAFLYHPRAIRKLKEDFARDLEESEELRLDRLPSDWRRNMAISALTRVLSPLL